MISYDEALSLVLQQSIPLTTSIVPLKEALFKISVQDSISDRDYPPFNRATMDGYAFYWDKATPPSTLAIQGTLYAGSTYTDPIPFPTGIKIMTGAPVPSNLNVVVKKEDTQVQDNLVSFNSNLELKPFLNIALQGEDVKKGSTVVPKNSKILPTHIPILASIGCNPIEVYSPLQIGLLSTGNEIVDSTVSSLETHQIRNSNSVTIPALLHSYPLQFTGEHIEDNKTKLSETIKRYHNQNILIITGGVSAGEADYTPDVLIDLGYTCLFHKVAIKPGKPIWFGVHPTSGQVVFALPGNPYSVVSSIKVFVEPFIQHLLHQYTPPSTIISNESRPKKNTLDEFLPVRCIDNKIQFLPFNGSGDVSMLVNASGLVRHPTSGGIQIGDTLPYYPF